MSHLFNFEKRDGTMACSQCGKSEEFLSSQVGLDGRKPPCSDPPAAARTDPAPESLQVKTITVITPPLDKHDVAEVETLSLQSNAELTAYKKESHGSLYFGANLDQLVMRIQQLSDGDVCRLGGKFFDSFANKRQHEQVSAKVLEIEAALCVERDVGPGAHRHNNYIFYNDKNIPILEIDGIIVHVGGERVANSTAYIVECSSSPQLSEVEKLLEKVKKFECEAKTDKHFSACTNFIPVLGGRHWDASVTKECFARKVWTVSPNGLGYSVLRNFSTLVRRLPK